MKYPAIIEALADKKVRARLKSIYWRLNQAGTTDDYSRVDEDGKPGKITYLELVRYGIGGVSFKTIGELLDAMKDTKQ